MKRFFFSRKGDLMKKLCSVSAMLAMVLALGLALLSCDNGMAANSTTGNGSEIPPDLRNTAWTRQISDSETVTINFGRNTMTMSSNKVSSQYNQQWDYRGANCCGYGYCYFYDGSNSLDFRYTCGNNGLSITGSRVQSLNGNWARK